LAILGGLVGTVAAYNMGPHYKSLIQVIYDDMDYAKQKKLFDAIQSVVSSIDITDIAKFVFLLSNSSSIKQAIIHEAINFISNEMSLQIAQN